MGPICGHLQAVVFRSQPKGLGRGRGLVQSLYTPPSSCLLLSFRFFGAQLSPEAPASTAVAQLQEVVYPNLLQPQGMLCCLTVQWGN